MTNEDDEKVMTSMFSDYWGSFAYTGTPKSELHDEWSRYVESTEVGCDLKASPA